MLYNFITAKSTQIDCLGLAAESSPPLDRPATRTLSLSTVCRRVGSADKMAPAAAVATTVLITVIE